MSSPASSHPAPDRPGSLATHSLNGVEIAFGLGAALVGLILSFISQWAGKSSFYTEPATSHGDTVEAELAGPRSA